MHNLKHNKVVHERVVIMNVVTEPMPRVAEANRFEIEKLSGGFPAGHAAFRLHGKPARACRHGADAQGRLQVRHHDDVVLPGKTDAEDIAGVGHAAMAGRAVTSRLSKQSANATDFFSIPSDRVVELGAQVTI